MRLQLDIAHESLEPPPEAALSCCTCCWNASWVAGGGWNVTEVLEGAAQLEVWCDAEQPFGTEN